MPHWHRHRLSSEEPKAEMTGVAESTVSKNTVKYGLEKYGFEKYGVSGAAKRTIDKRTSSQRPPKISVMEPRPIIIELPQSVHQQLDKLSRATRQSLEQIVADIVMRNMPPMPETDDPEAEVAMLQMQQLSQEKLLQISQSRVSQAHYQRFGDLLELHRDGALEPDERRELEALRLKADQLMQQKDYAQKILDWRGKVSPS